MDSTKNSAELSICISFRTSGTQTALLNPVGSILKSNLKLLHQAFDECCSQKKDSIIFDMSKIATVDSAGWKCVIAEHQRLNWQNVNLLLCGLRPEMTADVIFYGEEYADMVTVFPTIHDCQKAIKPPAEHQKKSVLPKPTPVVDAVQNEISEKSSMKPQPQKAHTSDKTGVPVAEKITTIISMYGPISVKDILAHLRSDEFNNMKIGLVELNKILNEMDLNSLEKRERYFRTT